MINLLFTILFASLTGAMAVVAYASYRLQLKSLMLNLIYLVVSITLTILAALKALP